MLAVLSPLMFSGWGWVFGWIRPSGTEDLLAKYSKITLKESEDNIKYVHDVYALHKIVKCSFQSS